MSKKSFKIGNELLQGISDTIGSSQTLHNKLQTENIPLSRIILDPENARKLHVNLNDIKNGLDKSDDLYTIKYDEIEELREFGEEIKEDGIIQPITVYQVDNQFMLIAGERRVLSSILIGLEYIPAIIRKKPSNDYKISRLQWNENIKRKDLNLWEKLSGLQRLINSYVNDIDPSAKLSAELIIKVANLSKTVAYRYLAVLQSDEVFKSHIKSGKINNIKKAEELLKLSKNRPIAEVIDNLDSSFTLESIKQQNIKRNKKPVKSTSSAGRKASQVTLGKTKQVGVAKKILDAVRTQYDLELDISINWDDMGSINKGFKLLVKQLERMSNDK